MKRTLKSLLLLVLACTPFLLPVSPVFAAQAVPTTLDTFHAVFPRYRIDNEMQRISIAGSGPGAAELESSLTKVFLERTDIKVVEPANVRSAMAGRSSSIRRA